MCGNILYKLSNNMQHLWSDFAKCEAVDLLNEELLSEIKTWQNKEYFDQMEENI